MGIYTEQLPQAVADQLRAERAAKGLLVKDLARITGISVNTISRYLNQSSPIPMDAFAAMCEALGEAPSIILGRAMERIPKS